MSKRNRIIYWIATIWLSLGMISTGIVQLMNVPSEVEVITGLGYPAYIITLLAISKILGVIAILLPKFPVLKEWAYAGFIFTMTGAIYSHLAAGDPVIKSLPPLLLLVLSFISWYFRPGNRKVSRLAVN